jgi:hypothetical protein
VKIDLVVAQETKQRIKIAQLNRTIRQMQNEITRLRRNDNYIPNPRISVPKQISNPPQDQRLRFENDDSQQK